jgi:hypothetical protein
MAAQTDLPSLCESAFLHRLDPKQTCSDRPAADEVLH